MVQMQSWHQTAEQAMHANMKHMCYQGSINVVQKQGERDIILTQHTSLLHMRFVLSQEPPAGQVSRI